MSGSGKPFTTMPVHRRKDYEVTVGPQRLQVRYRANGSNEVACGAKHYAGRIDRATVVWQGPWVLRGFGANNYHEQLLADVQHTLAQRPQEPADPPPRGGTVYLVGAQCPRQPPTPHIV